MGRGRGANGVGHPTQLRVPLSVDPGEAPRARRLLAKSFHAWQYPQADVALLLVSELVTNALRYGRPPLELRAELRQGVLRVEVHDAAGDIRPSPEAQLPSWEQAGGRGMIIVDALASRWGWAQSDGGGKHVWFEIDL